MGKKATALLKNIYETDAIILTNEEEYFSTSLSEILEEDEISTKAQNRRERKAKKLEKKQTEKMASTTKSVFGNKISSISVKSTCNKCGELIYGELINMIYHPLEDRMNPFFTYNCQNCGHSGQRSDYSKSLPTRAFLSYYKIDD